MVIVSNSFLSLQEIDHLSKEHTKLWHWAHFTPCICFEWGFSIITTTRSVSSSASIFNTLGGKWTGAVELLDIRTQPGLLPDICSAALVVPGGIHSSYAKDITSTALPRSSGLFCFFFFVLFLFLFIMHSRFWAATSERNISFSASLSRHFFLMTGMMRAPRCLESISVVAESPHYKTQWPLQNPTVPQISASQSLQSPWCILSDLWCMPISSVTLWLPGGKRWLFILESSMPSPMSQALYWLNNCTTYHILDFL